MRVLVNSKPIKEQLQGKKLTIINRREIVGRPLAALLANYGAKVGRENHHSKRQKEHVYSSLVIGSLVPLISKT